ncbi:MAG: hypothetical protein H7Y36_11945 [Armatimonadetes bacterium]|nr:hypothetical protein [Akkermansiaceae bacterium]
MASCRHDSISVRRGAQAYLDGVTVSTPTGANAFAPSGQTSFGGYPAGGRNFNGLIDDVQISAAP